MAYIDATYYNDVYKGLPVADPDLLGRLIERASDLIDQLTGYALQTNPKVFNIDFINNQVKKATASQVEYLAINGETSSTSMVDTPVMQVGKFRYGLLRGGKSEGSVKDVRFSPGAIAYLKITGLLYKGVTTHG